MVGRVNEARANYEKAEAIRVVLNVRVHAGDHREA
jgi:hypothetical protein